MSLENWVKEVKVTVSALWSSDFWLKSGRLEMLGRNSRTSWGGNWNLKAETEVKKRPQVSVCKCQIFLLCSLPSHPRTSHISSINWFFTWLEIFCKMSGSASAAPFQMPGHFWDAEKKRFFKLGSKPREPQPETHPTTSISSNASRNSSRSTKPNKRLKTERDVESSSSRSSSHFSLFNSFDSQLLNLRRSIHPAQVALSSIDSSISRTYKSNVTTQFMSKLSFSHKDTLPFSVGRHPITCFSNVVREKEKNGSTRWIYVGDSRGAVW